MRIKGAPHLLSGQRREGWRSVAKPSRACFDSDMRAPSKIGLIGYGVAGSAFHAPLIATTPGLTLAAVVTRDDERAAAVLARYPEAVVVSEVEQLWSLGLDAVTIATPNSTHAGLAGEALSRDISVVVDKPLAVSLPEGEEVVARAIDSDALLTVFFNRRWDSDFLTLVDLLDGGSLGRVARFESRFERWRPQVATTWKETAGAGEGGGILYDLGPHVIDQALLLFGPVEGVYAEVDRTRPGATNPDDVFIALTHISGVRSHLFMSAAAADLGPRFRVLGTSGGYRIFGLDGQEDALRAGRRPDTEDGGWGTEPESRTGILSGSAAPEAIPTLPGDYPAFYREWSSALHGQGPVPVDPADAIAGLRIIEAAQRSSDTGAVVLLAP